MSKSGTVKLNRRVLFRPKRYKYVKGVKDKGECVFCIAAKKKISLQTLCLYQTDHSMVILNKFPYNSGHLLVLPKRHVGDLLKLTDVEYLDLQLTLRLAAQAIEKVYQPSGFNMGLNHGKAAGAGIPKHIHYHLVPRWEGDLNFFPLIADTKVVIEDLDQSYAKLFQFFKGVS